MNNTIVTIFIPQELCHNGISEDMIIKKEKSHYLYGYYTEQICERGGVNVLQHTIVITTVCEQLLPDAILLGRSNSDEIPPQMDHNSQQSVWVAIDLLSQPLVSSVYIKTHRMDLNLLNVILFDLNDIQNSDLLLLRYCNSKSDPISYLISSVKTSKQKKVPSCFTLLVLYPVFDIIIWLLLLIISSVRLCTRIQDNLLKLCGYRSATLHQIFIRYEQLNEIEHMLSLIRNLPRGKDESSWRSRVESCLRLHDNGHKSDAVGVRSPCLVAGRLACVIVTDMLLGWLLLCYLYTALPVLVETFGHTTQVVSNSVLQLLAWLRGAPAGLKLNQPLTRALATFFSYHVGLWTLYLEVASDVVFGLCVALVWCGAFGATVQVALLSDLIHFATLHLHCFYVYAARLHMVQVSVLGSQWRAFRGHKWNPLKERIDSLQERRPLARVITAVVFTLAVFLLPTTTAYYLVFLAVRLVLYAGHSALSLLTWLLHHNPLYVVALHCFCSHKIKGEVVLSRNSKGCLLLTTRPTGMSENLNVFSAPKSLPPLSLPSPNTLLANILYAKELI